MKLFGEISPFNPSELETKISVNWFSINSTNQNEPSCPISQPFTQILRQTCVTKKLGAVFYQKLMERGSTCALEFSHSNKAIKIIE